MEKLYVINDRGDCVKTTTPDVAEDDKKYNETYCCYENHIADMTEQERDVREMWGIERAYEKKIREKIIAYLDKHNSEVGVRRYMFFTTRTDDNLCAETGKEYEIVYPHHFCKNEAYHFLVCKTYLGKDGKNGMCDCDTMDTKEGWECRYICVELSGLTDLNGIVRALDL